MKLIRHTGYMMKTHGDQIWWVEQYAKLNDTQMHMQCICTIYMTLSTLMFGGGVNHCNRQGYFFKIKNNVELIKSVKNWQKSGIKFAN